MRVSVFNNTQERVLIADLAIVVVEVVSDEELEAASRRGALLGAVGGALAGAASLSGGRLMLTPKNVPPLAEIRDVMRCAAFEVPDELSRIPEWPQAGEFRPVTIYPKSLVRRAAARWFRGIVLELAREAAPEQDIRVSVFQMPRLKRALASHGYPIPT